MAIDLAGVRGAYRPGRRVRFVEFGEKDPSGLPVGCEGTIRLVDSMGTVHVDWENGVRLGMVVQPPNGERPDRIVVIS